MGNITKVIKVDKDELCNIDSLYFRMLRTTPGIVKIYDSKFQLEQNFCVKFLPVHDVG